MEKLLTVVAESPEVEKRLIQSLRDVLEDHDHELNILSSHTKGESGEMHWIDAHTPDLKSIVSTSYHDKKTVFLIIYEEDKNFDWGSDLSHFIHDVVVFPFRKAELISKLRLHYYFKLWNEVGELNQSFQGLVSRLNDDVDLAARLQKAALPSRFPDIKGFKAESRYLAGARAGGDYFDLGESKDGSRVSLILSDSSSYGLSSAFISTLMRVTMKLSVNEVRAAMDTVKLIYGDLLLALKEKDILSMFYGVLNRRDYVLKFVHLGTNAICLAKEGKDFEWVTATGEPIRRHGFSFDRVTEGTLQLDSKDRLVFMTDGFIEAAGGREATLALLNQFRSKDQKDLLNELGFLVKRKLKDEDDLPEQDCAAIVMDVDGKILRLTT